MLQTVYLSTKELLDMGTTATIMYGATSSARNLNRGAQTTETAIRKASRERGSQCDRLTACIGKELQFRVKPNHNQKIVVASRHPRLDSCPQEEWKTGDSISLGVTLRSGTEFTATVLRADISPSGRSGLVVAVSRTTMPGSRDAWLFPGKEYQLWLDEVKVISGLNEDEEV